MKKITRAQIRTIISLTPSHLSENEKDEMAIPSYLHWNPLIRWLMWKRYETIAKLFGHSNNGNALEFGCGVGLFLPELAARYSKVYAIELFPDYAKKLSQQFSLDTIFIENLNTVSNNSFDCIVAADVLEHINDVQEILYFFHQKLKPEGKLLISGPTENIAYQIGRFIAGFSGKAEYHHTDIDDIISLACKQGYILESVVSLPAPLFPKLFRVCRLGIKKI